MGALMIKSPDQVTAERDQDDQQRRDNANPQVQAVQSELARYVRARWEEAKQAKIDVTRRLIDCLRRRKGEYSPEKLAELQAAGHTPIWMGISEAKANAAKAWLGDLFNADRPFVLDPSPVADLPPDIMQRLVMEAFQGAAQLGVPMEQVQVLIEKHKDRLMDELRQEAEDRADRMADEIEDMLLDGEWREAFDEFLDDLVTYPAAIIRGLEFFQKRTMKWVDVGNGQFKPQPVREIGKRVRRVSPFNAFPSPHANNRLDEDWFIELVKFSATELSGLRNAPGFSAEGIALVLTQYAVSGLREWAWNNEQERLLTTGRYSDYAKGGDIDGLEFSGSLSGEQLIQMGMNAEAIPDPLEYYQVSITVIANTVIRALVNPDPAGKGDYFKACWRSVPGSFWGKALMEILKDQQDMCNGAARALAMNMAMSSGPQVGIDHSRLVAGADAKTMHPWKIWPLKSDGSMSTTQPISFFQPDNHARELMDVYERFSKYADEITGLPAYAYGSDTGAGAAKTASGLSMLMNAASKSVKQVVRNVDIYVIEPLVEKCYNHLMMFSPKAEIKGDLRPRARGSDELLHKEAAAIKQMELLQITGANPVDMNIIGTEGRRSQLEEVFKSGEIPAERIVPSRDELAQRVTAEQQAALANGGPDAEQDQQPE